MSALFRVGLDIDGILYRWSDTARFLLLNQFGIEIDGNSPEYENWGFVESHATPAQVDWLWGEGVTKYGLFRHGSLWKGSVEAVRRIAELPRAELVFITSRPKTAYQDTFDWLHLHFRDSFKDENVHVLWNKVKYPKSSVRPQCEIYLDDKPANAADFANNTGGLSVLWDRSYNKSEQLQLPESVALVDSWQQFVDLTEERYGVWQRLHD